MTFDSPESDSSKLVELGSAARSDAQETMKSALKQLLDTTGNSVRLSGPTPASNRLLNPGYSGPKIVPKDNADG